MNSVGDHAFPFHLNFEIGERSRGRNVIRSNVSWAEDTSENHRLVLAVNKIFSFCLDY